MTITAHSRLQRVAAGCFLSACLLTALSAEEGKVPTDEEMRKNQEIVNATLAKMGYQKPPAPTIRESLGMVPASPLVHQPAPPLTVGEWLVGDPLVNFNPDETYALCVMSILEFDKMLSQFDELRWPPKPSIPWIVVLTTEMPFKIPASTTADKLVAWKADMSKSVRDEKTKLAPLHMRVAWDSPEGAMRAAFPATPSIQSSTAVIHHGRVLWAGSGTRERPMLTFVSHYAGPLNGNLDWLLKGAAETQVRALPLVELAMKISDRGYPEPGEWDRLTVLAMQLERADLGVGFIDHIGVGFVDRVLAGGVLENGMFLSQVYLWRQITNLADNALRLDSKLTAEQREAVLAELRHLATADEYESKVRKARATALFREILRLKKQGGNDGRITELMPQLEENGTPVSLFIDARSLMETCHDRELAQRLIIAGKVKLGTTIDPSSIKLCVEAQVAIGDPDGARATVQEALKAVTESSVRLRLEKILSTIK